MSVLELPELESIGNQNRRLLSVDCDVIAPKLKEIYNEIDGSYTMIYCRNIILDTCEKIHFRYYGATNTYMFGKLVSLIAPSCYYVSSNESSIKGILSTTSTRKVVFGKLTTFTGFFRINYIWDDIIHFEVGQDTGINLNLKLMRNSNCCSSTLNNLVEDTDLFTCNIQQFLYNFRTYLIDRLFNYTGGSTHTLTLHSNVYNAVLGLDSEGYASTFHMPDEPSVDYVTSLNQKLTDINWGLAYV